MRRRARFWKLKLAAAFHESHSHLFNRSIIIYRPPDHRCYHPLSLTAQILFRRLYSARAAQSQSESQPQLSLDLINMMEQKLSAIENRHSHLEAIMNQPDASPEEYSTANKELKKLQKTIAVVAQLRKIQQEIGGLKSLIDEAQEDRDMREMAAEELGQASQEEERLRFVLLKSLLFKDDADERDSILEVRAGTGGREASLFAMEIFRMYEKYSQQKGWKFEILGVAESDLKGYKEASAAISGADVYGKLTFESGIHRVQVGSPPLSSLRMTKFKSYGFLQQWRYVGDHRLLRPFSFLQCRFSSSVALSHVFPDQPTRNIAAASSIPVFDSHAYSRLLQGCTKNNDPITGRIIHCDILKRGNCLDLFSRNILLNLYLKMGLLSDGLKVFDEMPERNVVSFVTMIQGFSQVEEYDKAVNLFFRLHKEGHELNPFVFTTILKLLVTMDWLELALCAHACIYKLGFGSDAFVGTALIDAYSVYGAVSDAKEVFKGIVQRDMVCWTGMVSCYAENDCFEDSLNLFNQMRLEGLMPNNYTFASVIKACVGLGTVKAGKSIHGCIIKTCYEMDRYVGVSLLDLYTRSRDINDAREVFEEIPKDNVVPWSFMISRYSQSGCNQEALDMFQRMRKSLVSPNQFTLASVLQACASEEELQLGSQVHCHMVKVGLDLNVFAMNALMDVYAKCGKMGSSMDLFLHSTNKNEVSWNTMIVGYVQQEDAEEAFLMFLNMLELHVRATGVTYSSLLRAAAGLAALEVGIQIHSMTIKTMYDGDAAVTNALIDMYAKCGRIRDARSIFDSMSEQDVVSWNTMISAYSMHGLGAEALELFESMRKTKFRPNPLTFVAVLSACSNTGSMDQGQSYFTSMQEDYGFEPLMEHYTCMVSLLGRLGHIDKAVNMIREIPHEPSIMVWRALLGACVAHKNVEFGRFSAEKVLELDPQDESTYVLLSNIYAGAKRWDNVAIVRKRMKRKKVKKEPGLSWVENQGVVHYFVVGDDSHEDIKLIRSMLEWLNLRSSRVGYAPNHDAVLLNVEEGEKSRLLWMHSERIALAYALLRTPPGSPIRIIKNLRICADCHVALKLASKFVHREIVVRDINRFHHFHDGSCSCNDYW